MQRWRFFLAQLITAGAVLGAGVGISQNSPPSQVGLIVLITFLLNGIILNWGDQGQQAVRDESAHIIVRAIASAFMWLIYAAAIMTGINMVGAVVIPIAAIMMVPLLVLSVQMWKIPGSSDRAVASQLAQTEKRKRDRLDAVIRDLSDEELVRLKQRLAEGDVTEDQLHYMLGDDGELMMMED